MVSAAPLPTDEAQRLSALWALNILDTPPEPGFDRITHLAARLFDVPVALVSLVDAERQWFKSCIGLDVAETDRNLAFCAWAILTPDVFIVEDTAEDPRFASNPLVLGEPRIRFYAGAPIISAQGHRLGTVCIIDRKPRRLTRSDQDTLRDLAAVVSDYLDTRGLSEKLQASRDRFELAVNGSGAGIWDWDIVTGELFWSHRFMEMMGVEDQSFEPHFDEFADRLHPDDREEVLEALRRHLEDRDPYNLIYRLRGNDGEYRHVHAAGQAQWANDGKPLRMAGSAVDVSDSYAARSELQRTNERLTDTIAELEQYTYVTSHDLRAPLRGIDAIAGWLQDDLGEDLDEKHQQYLVVMRRRILRLQTLISDLLAYYRVAERGGLAETVDTGALVQGIHDLNNATAFELVLPPDGLPVLHTIQAPLALVFTNLLQNAIKHHDRPAGRIEISATELADAWEFAVADDGPGIEPRFHDKVFGLFQTLRPRDEVEGSGIGLPMVRRTLRSIDQEIRIESDPALARGTRFVFTWPKSWPTGVEADARLSRSLEP